MLVPTVRRTWAPRGRTPILRCAGHWTKISASSAITVSPKRTRLALYARFHPNKNIGSAETAVFLRQLARHLRGRVLVLWDGGNQHKGTPVRHFRLRHPAWEFHRFPGYAPELNPDEFVWALLKRAVANSVPKDNAHLKRLLHGPLMRLRQSQRLLWSCIHASELPWS
ncbi:MAG: hypothetical protein E6J01_17975 [Chloroflexi bacterium]|nr:MAG: hypothetical protein E6J01_17975 [Chloroflexota bacterium]